MPLLPGVGALNADVRPEKYTGPTTPGLQAVGGPLEPPPASV